MLKSGKPPPASDISGVGGEESHLREQERGRPEDDRTPGGVSWKINITVCDENGIIMICTPCGWLDGKPQIIIR